MVAIIYLRHLNVKKKMWMETPNLDKFSVYAVHIMNYLNR